MIFFVFFDIILCGSRAMKKGFFCICSGRLFSSTNYVPVFSPLIRDAPVKRRVIVLNVLKKYREQGVPLRILNGVAGGIVAVLSALLIVSLFRSFFGFDTLQKASDLHAQLRQSSYELQIASDYLTEQARCFTVCGKREHLDNYFEEADVTRRRDRALEVLQKELGDTAAYQALQKAMNQSVNLMDTEYYAMRMALEARDEDLSSYPACIREVVLKEEDLRLSDEEQAARARDLVFDENYHNQKKIISENTQACLQTLDQIMAEREKNADSTMKRILWAGAVLGVLLILCVTGILYLNTRLLIRPLLKAVSEIRNNSLLTVEGAHEFRYLAQTYNNVYDSNQEQSERLAYEASHDRLTGLSNRSSFELVMDSIKSQEYAMLLIDVDHFKHINDNQGHDTGDIALNTVGDVIRKSFRDQDFVFRIGGDEFAVILLKMTSAYKDVIAGKITTINRRLSELEDDRLRTTISAGVAFNKGEMPTEEIFHRADQALYQAKNKGRKRCVFAE